MGKPHIKPRSSRDIAERGEIICQSGKPELNEVLMKMNTSTAYLSLPEAFRVIRSLDDACTKTWGGRWTELFTQGSD